MSRDTVVPLQKCWLYAIASQSDLARRLNLQVDYSRLSAFARRKDNHKQFAICSSGGKHRDVEEPKKQLQRIHKRVHQLLQKVEAPDYLCSTVKGSCYIKNAIKHPADHATFKVDIKKFFQSIHRINVYHFFKDQMRCRSDVAGTLADLLTFRDHLPTGGAASPIMSYFVYKEMFDDLDALARYNNVVMSLYVDDLTFSAPCFEDGFITRVRRIIADFGLRSHKLKKFGPTEPKVITGTCITNNGPKVPNKLHRAIATTFSEQAKAKTDVDLQRATSKLHGQMAAAGRIEPVFQQRLKNLRASSLREVTAN